MQVKICSPSIESIFSQQVASAGVRALKVSRVSVFASSWSGDGLALGFGLDGGKLCPVGVAGLHGI